MPRCFINSLSMSENEIFTIELNLDGDGASSCAYHVDYLKRTIKRNIEHAERKQATNRWVLVGLARDINEAQDEVKRLKTLLCNL